MATLLADAGVITIEFPHLQKLIEGNQFDTIYHEHYSYFSLTTVARMASRHGLMLIDVEELPTHGGSLRVYLSHEGSNHPSTTRVFELITREKQLGFRDISSYAAFAEKVTRAKRELLAFLIHAKNCGKRIAGYGAPGKGNTLLNY